ncbi:MAG: Ig-like domain-containing protein [archaeon]
MKRGILIFTFIILLSFFVAAAPTVTLSSPTNGASEGSTVTMTCSATDVSSMTSLQLYSNTGGSWISIETNSTAGTSIAISKQVTSLSDGTYTWNCKATGVETAWAASNYTFTVAGTTVSFSGPITNQTLTEDTTSSNAFDLDTYFTGATTYTYSGNTNIAVSVAGDNQVTLTPGANWTGSETITFTGTGSNSVNSNAILVNVTAVNDNPYLTESISNQTIEYNTNKTLTLSSYFSDVDGDTLNYSASGNSNIVITFSGATATLDPNADWTGSETITFTATDGTLSATSNSVTLTVNGTTTSTNSAPTIDSSSPDSNPTLSSGETQDFSITYSDSDSNSTLTIKWYLDGTEVSTSDSYTFTASDTGSFTVKAEVSDGTDTTTKTWTVTVAVLFEEVDENVDVNSILSEQTSSGVCGNGKIESGENCLNCLLDVKCGSGEICNKGVCESKDGIGKTIAIFLIIVIILVGGGIAVYYFMVVRKPQKPQKKQPFKYREVKGETPPADYTDFYKKK